MRRFSVSWRPDHLWQDHSVHRDRPVRIVSGVVACQRAGVRSAIVGNWRSLILADNPDIKINQPLPGNAGSNGSHPMSRVAGRAGKTIARNVAAVLRPTRVGHDVV